MATDLATTDHSAILEKVVLEGDLSRLSPEERIQYYGRVCDSLGLNPYTKPFDYLKLNGRTVLYATKAATEQLARLHNISIALSDPQVMDDVVTIRATAAAADRSADATGAVSVAGLRGEQKANAYMKAETKASRRAVLRLVGLGWLDESEVDSIPNAARVEVDSSSGEITDRPALPSHRSVPNNWQRFTDWLTEQIRTLTDVSDVIGVEATEAAVVNFITSNGIGGWGAFQEYLVQQWSGQGDGPPEQEVIEAPPEDALSDWNELQAQAREH